MKYGDLSPKLRQGVKDGYRLAEHRRAGVASHLSTIVESVMHGRYADDGTPTFYFCRNECYDTFPAEGFTEIEVEDAPDAGAPLRLEEVELTVAISALSLAEALKTAAQAGAQALAEVRETALAALQARMREVYAESLGGSDASVRNLMASLLFMSWNSGRVPQPGDEDFNKFVRRLDSELSG